MWWAATRAAPTAAGGYADPPLRLGGAVRGDDLLGDVGGFDGAGEALADADRRGGVGRIHLPSVRIQGQRDLVASAAPRRPLPATVAERPVLGRRRVVGGQAIADVVLGPGAVLRYGILGHEAARDQGVDGTAVVAAVVLADHRVKAFAPDADHVSAPVALGGGQPALATHDRGGVFGETWHGRRSFLVDGLTTKAQRTQRLGVLCVFVVQMA